MRCVAKRRRTSITSRTSRTSRTRCSARVVAAALLACGRSVVPVGVDKHPLIPWKEFRTRRASHAEVESWFARWPDAGIAIVTGTISNILVLDADGDPGVAEAERLGIPRTPTASTPRGGKHFLFALPKGVIIPNRAHLGASKSIDIRGEGGYIVAPPSVGANGNAYSWLIRPDEAPLAEPPRWLLDLLARKGVAKAKARARQLVHTAFVRPLGLRPLLDKLPPRIRKLIEVGHHPGDGHPSRSEGDLAVVYALVEAGASREEIEAVFESCPIGAKYREKGISGAAYLDMTIENAQSFTPSRPKKVLPTQTVWIANADLQATPPGEHRGKRIHLRFFGVGGPYNRKQIRTGVSVPDAQRRCEERYEAFFEAVGRTPPEPEEITQADLDTLWGKHLAIEVDESDRRENAIVRFLPVCGTSGRTKRLVHQAQGSTKPRRRQTRHRARRRS